jgi:hypothetical protein
MHHHIIDETLKILPVEKRDPIRKRIFELAASGQYDYDIKDQDIPRVPVDLLNKALDEYGYILVSPNEHKDQNRYNKKGMIITGVARRSVHDNVNGDSTSKGVGFHTYIPKYVTVKDKAHMHDRHDYMFLICISVREGVAEFEWSLTEDKHGKVATIRYNRAMGKVDTSGDSVLKKHFETYFVYGIDELGTPPHFYFEAVHYSDFSEQTPLLEPDVIRNMEIEHPYSPFRAQQTASGHCRRRHQQESWLLP